MGLKVLSLLLLLPALSLGQTFVTTMNGQEIKPSYQPIIQANGKTLPTARGVWRVNGYGYFAEITDSGVKLFHETSSVMWEVDEFDSEELAISIIGDSNRALISTNDSTPPYFVERTERVSKSKLPKTWSPTLLYKAFAETMDENYVFFEERKFDWNQRSQQIAPKINDSLSEAELFGLLEASLTGLEDAHVQLGATIDGEPRRPMFGMSATEKQGVEVFQGQDNFEEFDEFLNDRIQTYEAAIATRILVGKAKQACNQLTWGVTEGNVGYLHIAGMSEFSDADSKGEQLQELHNEINTALRDLAETRMLIVDVSTNGGGSDEFSIAIASHFADKRRLAFSKGPRKHLNIRHLVYTEPYQGDGAVTYTKPVRLVINDVTVSAAEIFVLSMKDLPHVKLVGKRTRGALSDVLPKTLPNGWAFGLSNEIYLDSKGKCYEAIGIPPDVEMQVIDPTKPDLGHADAILKIAATAK